MKECKNCSRCKQALSANSNNFSRDSRATDGLSSACRDCGKRANYDRLARIDSAVSAQQKQHMIFAQDNVCPICLKPNPKAVSYNRKTGKARGVLHPSCDAALGLLGQDFDRALRAAKYLCEQDGVI